MRKYGIVEALKILQVKRDRLHYWIKYQRLTRPVVPGKGRGAKTKLSFENLFELSIAREMADLGVELDLIKLILETKHAGQNQKGETDPNIQLSFAKYAIMKYVNANQKEECLFLQILKIPAIEGQFRYMPIEYRPDLGKWIEDNMDVDCRGASIVLDAFGILKALERATGETI